MSMWTSLRDSVEKVGVATVKGMTGVSLAPLASNSAQGIIPASTAAPSGAVALGGVPNKNPSIFGAGGMTTQTMLLIFGGILVLIFMFKKA